MTEEEFEFKLSFVSLDDDKETILLNGEPKYAVALPVNISKKDAASKKDIITKLILDGCDKFGIDYVGEENVSKLAKEVVDQFYERARELQIVDSVSDVIRMNKGQVMLNTIKIVGVSPPYKMITQVILECRKCKETWTEDFNDKPQMSYRQTMKYCPRCIKNKNRDQIDLFAHIEHIDAKTITVQDVDLRDDLEKLPVILLEEQTRNVRVGETATITGDVDVLNPTGVGGKKPITIMYATHIRYEREEEAPITQDDIALFKQFAQKDTVINDLVNMFAPQVIWHSDAKLGILRSAVSVRETKHHTGIRSRTHTDLAGDPGTAKSMLATEATKIVPNSRYVTAQHVSIKSALAIIDKEIDGSKMLMLGAVPQARNAICAINEIGSMEFEDQQHLADILEEGRFTIDKHGIYQEIDSPTTVIATTNPEGGYWNRSFPPSLDQLPIKSNIRDRFDQTYIFEDFQTAEERREYTMKKMEIYQNPESVKVDYNFLKRYLQYAASLQDPILTAEAAVMLSDFWIRMTEQGLAANRSFDSLVRIARGQARLHLKEEIDVQIANEVMQDIHLMFVKMGKRVDPTVEDPRVITYNEIIQYTNTLADGTSITFIEATKHVHAHNNSIKQYLGGKSWSIAENKRLRHVHDMFSDGAVVGKLKIGRGDLAVVITNTNPLTIAKADKPNAMVVVRKTGDETKESGGQVGQTSVDRLTSGQAKTSSFDQFDQYQTKPRPPPIAELIHKAMSDGQGCSKGYCTEQDFVFVTQMEPNLHWSEDDAEQTFYALLGEGKLTEFELGRFKPV